MVKVSPELALKLKNLPTGPGVYLLKGTRNRVLYIGKAKNLRARVRTYFQDSGRHDPKTQRLMSKVVDLDLVVTANEIESFILEANLVHEHKPRYNVMLKDDKHFPYIKVTTNEPFPRLLIVRRFERDGATYFGPYTSARHMRTTVRFLGRLFKIRTCDLVIPAPEGKKHKVCLDYHMKRCGGPCENLQSQEDYAESVDAVILALRGKSRDLIARLEEKMQQAASDLEFEDAKEARDQIEALQAVVFKQSVDVGEFVERDIVSIAREGTDAVAVVMQIRDGILIGRQDFQLTADDSDPDETVLQTFVTQYYNHQPNLPAELYLPLDLPEVDLLAEWLRRQRGKAVRVATPQRGEKVRLVELAARNARLLLDELLIQKRGQRERTSRMVSSLKEQLKLPRSPRTMVCFDISNTGETDAVGSCVFFENGKPKKSEYRHFRIKGRRGQDDFRMMREVVGRYFHRRVEEARPLPDLVVVDGGKGQLSSAGAELKSLNLEEQQIIGLAKRLEEVFLPGLADPVTIGRGSPALMLLKRIRDEAHRFAITYNRKVRTRRTIASALDDIPGVGPARRAALLKAFGSVEGIRKASAEDLAAVKGIPPKLARVISEQLASRTV